MVPVNIPTQDDIVSGFCIRQARDDDRERIIALVSKMWAEDITARYEWLYLSNPHGRALTWLAIENITGEIAGCTSIFPRRVIVDGHERLGAIGGDCYVEPRARRRGLATALHRESLTGMRESGIDFMYGPPNSNNLGALVRAGSRVVTDFKRCVRPLTGRAVYRAAFDRPPTKLEERLADLTVMAWDRLIRAGANGITLEPVAEFGQEFDSLFERAAPGRSIVCARDSRYLTWRYLAAPSNCQRPFAIRRDGELLGFAALESSGEQAAIVDFFTVSDSKLIDAALQLILDEAMAAGRASLEMSCTPEHVIQSRLRRMGFIGRSGRGFQVAASDQDPQLETLLNPDAWHFLAADQDMDTFFSPPPE